MSGSAAEWSVDRVSRWAASLPLEGAAAVAATLREEEVHGAALLTYAALDRKELKADLGLSLGKAATLWDAICELAADDAAAGAAAAKKPAPLGSAPEPEPEPQPEPELEPEERQQSPSVQLMLSKIKLLMHLNPVDRARIGDVLEQQMFAAGGIIMREGDDSLNPASTYMYFMEGGEAIAYVGGVESMRYKRGGYFGELSLLTKGARRKATIKAGSGGARCLKLSRAAFDTFEFTDAMRQERQDMYNTITDRTSIKTKKTDANPKGDIQYRSQAGANIGTLRGMGASLLSKLGGDIGAQPKGSLAYLVAQGGKTALNTPVFVAALTQQSHTDDTLLSVRRRVRAAITAGHRPNMTEVTNLDAVSGVCTLYHHYHCTMMVGAQRSTDFITAQEAASTAAIASIPLAFQVKVAIAAGMPRTLEAILALFQPDRRWMDTFDFREAVGKAVGLEDNSAVGSAGMQVMPVFEAVGFDPSTIDLISFDPAVERRPHCLLELVGANDYEALRWRN